jgi:hypothetical protein
MVKKKPKFEETLDRGPQPKKNRGRGRPKKERPQPEPAAGETGPAPELDIGIVAGVIKMPYEFWSISTGVKDLQLSDAEAEQIAQPAKQLLDYYLPKIPSVAYAWAALTVSIFFTTKPRLTVLAEKRQEKHESPSESPVGAAPGPAKNGPASSAAFPKANQMKVKNL